MFSFHWPELFIIFFLGLLIFGPKRLPEISGALGRGMRDFRRGLSEAKEETGFAEIQDNLRDVRDSVRSDLESAVNPSAGPAKPGDPAPR